MDHVKLGLTKVFSPKHRNTISLDSSAPLAVPSQIPVEFLSPLPFRVPTSEVMDSSLILSSEDHKQPRSPTQLQEVVNADDCEGVLPSISTPNSSLAIST